VDDAQIMIRAAVDGVGLAFMLEAQAAPHLASGALVRVLQDWCPPFAGYFLYYPSRRQQPAALSALIETLRLWRIFVCKMLSIGAPSVVSAFAVPPLVVANQGAHVFRTR